MYAVIQTGGKQYKVKEGEKIFVEKLEAKTGSKTTLNEVLLVGGNGGLKIGAPVLEGAKVEAEVLEQGRGEKIIIFKKKRRKGYRKKQGHRQSFTLLQIKKIVA